MELLLLLTPVGQSQARDGIEPRRSGRDQHCIVRPRRCGVHQVFRVQVSRFGAQGRADLAEFLGATIVEGQDGDGLQETAQGGQAFLYVGAAPGV